jgi:hypothetical protein
MCSLDHRYSAAQSHAQPVHLTTRLARLWHYMQPYHCTTTSIHQPAEAHPAMIYNAVHPEQEVYTDKRIAYPVITLAHTLCGYLPPDPNARELH